MYVNYIQAFHQIQYKRLLLIIEFTDLLYIVFYFYGTVNLCTSMTIVWMKSSCQEATQRNAVQT